MRTMNKSLFLVIDTSVLAYRALYSLGNLSHDDASIGAVYGTFQTVLNLIDVHNTNRVAWVFDQGHDKRTELCPSYKLGRRKNLTEEQKIAHSELRRQLFRLRTKYLPDIGFRNVFCQEGFEADDVIASVCLNLTSDQEAIVVSNDEDLFQLLSSQVSIWLPKGKMVTYESFVKQWGLEPKFWADVKAIAGCPGDNVLGVPGVGPKKACLYLRGLLKPDSKAYQAVESNKHLWERNLPLVKLPFEGVNDFKLQDDQLNTDRWNRVLESLGLRALRDRSSRRLSKGLW